MAPSIMQSIVEAARSKDDAVRQATSAYIDDVFINEDIVSATRVKQHLANFGLTSKEPERLKNSAWPNSSGKGQNANMGTRE